MSPVQVQAQASRPSCRPACYILLLLLMTGLVLGQETIDYTALAEPEYARRLELSDEQNARIATSLDERLNQLVAAAPGDRQRIIDASNSKLADILTEEQKAAFAAIIGGGKLRFNFRDEDWANVLDWFAEQGGLSLVMDQAPPGKFTYSDAKTYTAAEAIDLLNSVLLTKGFTLVRREKMLNVAPTSDGIPYDVVPRVTLDELPSRGRFEYVSVMFSLGRKPVEAVVAEVNAIKSAFGRVTPLPQTKQLLITDTAGRVAAMEKLIESIPEPKKEKPKEEKPQPQPPKPVLKIHSIRGLSAKAVYDMLKGLYGDLKMSADAKAEQLSVFTIPGQQAAIEQSITQMRANISGDNEPRLEIYSVMGEDLDELSDVLSKTTAGLQVSTDEEGNRLLVVGDLRQHAAVRETLGKLDALADNAATVVVYDVEPQLTDQLAELLEPLLPRASVVAQPGRIAVRGAPADQQIAKSAIDQLREAEEIEKPSLRFYPLGRRIDAELLETLKSLVPTARIMEVRDQRQLAAVATKTEQEVIAKALEQIDLELAEQSQQTLKFYPVSRRLRARFEKLKSNYQQQLADVRLTFDAAAPNELAAYASPAGHAALTRILAELRQESDEAAITMHRFEAAVAEPGRLLSLLQAKFPGTEMLLNEARDALLVWTDEMQLPQVRQEYDRLIAVLPALPQLRVYPAKEMDLNELQTLIQSVAKSANVSASAERKRLLVWASREDQERIVATLSSVQSGDPVDFKKVLISYPLTRSDPDVLVSLLRSLRPNVGFAADQRGKQIVVTATLSEQRQLKSIIEQLDRHPPAGSEEFVKTYPLKATRPSTVIGLIQPMFEEMRLTANDNSQQLIAAGTAADHEKLKLTLGQLDAEGKRGRVVAYDVAAADPDQVRSVLLQLVPRAVISANDETRSVVVWADEEDQLTIKEAIEQFSQSRDEGNRQLKSYPLPRGMGDTVLAVVRSVAPTATMDIDQSQGELVCWGTAAEHDAVRQALAELATSKLKQLEIYDVGSLDPAAVADSLRATFSHLDFPDSPDPSKLLVLSPPEQHPQIKATIERIVESTATEEKIVRVYAIDRKRLAADELIDNLDSELTAGMAIDASDESNSLIVRATSAKHDQLRAAIDEIMQQLPQMAERVATVYHLQNADPDVAETVLRRLLPNARFAEDRQTGSLAATAMPEEHEQIKAVVEQLDTPQRQTRWSTEIYRFDRASARSAEFAFERLAPQSRVSSLAGSNAVIATGSPADHELFREAAEKINGGGGGANVVRVYPLDKDQIDVEDLVASIDETLLSRVALRMNEAMNSVIVRGSEEDQAAIKEIVDEIVKQIPAVKKRVTQVYRFKHGNVRSARYVLRDMFDDAVIAYDNDTDVLAATASEADQREIQAIVQQMDQPAVSGKVTKIYRLASASARRVYPAFSEMVDDGRVSYDSESNSLVVTATDADHQRVRDAIDDLNGNAGEDVKTQVYSLQTADPNAIRQALTPLVPNASISSDPASGTLIVSGDAVDQAQIAEIVGNLDKAGGQQPVMRAYVVQEADPRTVHQSLAATFAGNGSFSISFQEATKTLFVVATPKNHVIFRDLVNQMDQPSLATAARSAKTYPLTGLSGEAAKTAITALFQDQLPAVNVEVDTAGTTLIVVGTAQQHERVTATLGTLAVGETNLEVFQLDYVDPWVVESAIDSLYEAQAAKPAVSSDYTSNRLFVRGSASQVRQIRDLLAKMGETSVAQRSAGVGGNVRKIPFRGDVSAAVGRIQQLWPRLRKNRIQVVAPAAPGLEINSPKPGEEESVDELGDGESPDSVRDDRAASRFVAWQTTTRAPEPEADPDVSDNDPTDAGVTNSPSAAPSIVIIPDDEEVTIASPDIEALDQLESILRAMSGVESNSAGADFAVFLLRNTGASDMRQLLDELFKQLRQNAESMPVGGPFGGVTAFGPSSGDVAVVADDRLNALIVHGARKDRALIEELLEVLDSEDLPNPIIVFQPELITLEHTQAGRILNILTNVYKSQLSTGGGRKSVDIPEGVSSEVASVLQQINAAAAAPVLTLDVDETTNSIVMRAPPELRQEIKAFVASLDAKAMTGRNQNVRVIRLQRSKSDRVQALLEGFLLQESNRD